MTVLASGSVYYWNLGWFGALDDQPYPMWMALPFAILAVAYLKTEKFKALHFSMICTTLIHPSIGIMLSGWVVFYFFSNRNRKRFLEFSINAVLNLIYILGTKSFMPSQAEMPKNIQDIALTNPHLNFFNVFSTEFSSSSIRIWILIVCLATVAIFQERKFLEFNRNHLVLSLAIYSIALLALQSIGLMTNQLLLISLVPARFTVLLATIAFLLVMAKLSQDLFSASLLKRASSFLTIIFPSPLLLILLLLRELPARILKKYKKGVVRTSELITIGVIGFLVLPTIITKFGYQLANKMYESDPYNSILNPLRTGFMNFIVPSLFSNTKVQILFISLFALICITPLKCKWIISVIGKRLWLTQPNWNAFMYFILSCSFVFASKTGMEYQLPWSYNGVKLEKITSYTEAQTWARTETPENSIFFIDGSMPPYYTWRTLSERPVSNPNPIWSLYNYPKYVDDYNKSRDLFWSRSLSTNKLDYYGQWDEKYFCLSQDLMKISYVVQNLDQPDLSFPIVYKNDFFQIFKVECK
jgi:hypothetical protein